MDAPRAGHRAGAHVFDTETRATTAGITQDETLIFNRRVNTDAIGGVDLVHHITQRNRGGEIDGHVAKQTILNANRSATNTSTTIEISKRTVARDSRVAPLDRECIETEW